MTIDNPKARKAAYYVFALVSTALGSIAVFCGSTDAYVLPDWVQPLTAAVNYVGAAFGLIAASNVAPAEPAEPAPAPASEPEPEPVPEPEPGTVPAV